MAISSIEFWGVNHYDHPALTDEMLAVAEKELGVTLPEAYIALLRIQNGGYTRGFAYPMSRPTTWAEDHVPLDDLAGIVTDREHRTAQNILHTPYMTKEWGLPPRQVLLSGDGHWWISLDYRESEVPGVAWLHIDHAQDFQIAPSFAAFLNGLVPASAFDDPEDA